MSARPERRTWSYPTAVALFPNALLDRGQLQVALQLDPAFLQGCLDPKKPRAQRMPHLDFRRSGDGKGAMFFLPAVLEWLELEFGEGNWGAGMLEERES